MKIDSPNNTVLVIGNGFDLNLGLKTSYTDFVNSACFKKIMPKNDLAKYLDAKHALQNWIDIEAKLSNYSNRTAGFRMSPKEVKEDYLELKRAMKEYLNTIDISSYNEGSFVGYFMVNLLTNMNILNRESISVISFNYTSTVELFPSIMTNISVSNKIKRYLGDVNYCHGKLTGSDVVFGVEDDAKIKKDHVFLRKATQFEAAIGSNKIYDVDSILRRKKNIIFIGHSLGKTDYSYFMDFFKDCCDGNIKNKNICFTYFNDDSKDKLYSEIDVLCNYQLSKLQKNNNISFIDTNKGEFTIKETKYIYPPVTP